MIKEVRTYTGSFFQLCSDIGTLDFIATLAVISSRSEFIEPNFNNQLCIIDSHHPINLLLGFSTSVSNNIVSTITILDMKMHLIFVKKYVLV